MLQDKTGKLWFANEEQGLVRFDGKSFSSFTEKDGLCSNLVSSMVQDANGTIWFGNNYNSEKGWKEGCVTRYDGKTFTPFSLAGLPNQSIWNILKDKTGNIWLGARNVGLYRYDGKSFTDFSDKKAMEAAR